MRPIFDPRFFPGLPKFLWFDDGTGGDASGGDASAGPGGNSGVGGSGGSSATDSGGGDDAAPSGNTGFGSSVSADNANTGAPTGEVSAAAQASVNASAAQAAAQAAANQGGGGGVAAPGAAPGGGVSTSAVGHSGVTGGGGGTASGGSGPGVGQGTNPAVQNLLGIASLLGLGPGGALSGAGIGSGMAVAGGPGPTGMEGGGRGSVNSPALGVPGVTQSLNQGLAQLAAAAGFGFGNTAPTLGGQGPRGGGGVATANQTMGFPSIEGVSPGLTAAPAGPTQGSPSMIGPAGPNGPSVAAQNAAAPAPTTAQGTDTGVTGLAPAASTALAQTPVSPNPAAPPTSPAGLSPSDIGTILQTLLGAIAERPQLPQLAQNAAMGLG
jgi:hypothetical protein